MCSASNVFCNRLALAVHRLSDHVCLWLCRIDLCLVPNLYNLFFTVILSFIPFRKLMTRKECHVGRQPVVHTSTHGLLCGRVYRIWDAALLVLVLRRSSTMGRLRLPCQMPQEAVKLRSSWCISIVGASTVAQNSSEYC
jgi:hypothetical protein